MALPDSLSQQIQQMLTQHLLCIRHCFWHWGYSSGLSCSCHQACGESRVGWTEGVLFTHLYRAVWGGEVQDRSTAPCLQRQAGIASGSHRLEEPRAPRPCLGSCCRLLGQCLPSDLKKRHRTLNFFFFLRNLQILHISKSMIGQKYYVTKTPPVCVGLVCSPSFFRDGSPMTDKKVHRNLSS